MKRSLRRLGVLVLALILLAFTGLAVWGSDRLVHPPRRDLQDYHRKILDQPADYGLEITPYTGPYGTPALLVLPTPRPGAAEKGRIARGRMEREGIVLRPWGETRGTIVLLHGFAGRKEDQLPIAERFCAVGFRCILLDLPGHGENPAPTATFGRTEVDLVSEIVGDAERRFSLPAGPVGLFGVSQGGAIALQAVGRTDAPWSAVASLGTFASLDQPVANAAASFNPHLASISPFTASACAVGVKCRAGFFPAEIRPLDAAARIRIPAFIGHGDQDTFIPFSAGVALYKAIPHTRKIFRPIRGAGHHNFLSLGSHDLYAELCRFYLDAMPAPPPSLLGKGKSRGAGVKPG